MLETQAKYHHLVPQTYMSFWAHGKGTLNVEFLKCPGVIVQKNKENIAGLNDFHSIKAGMPICTHSDTDIIFAAVQPFVVEYKGKVISDSLELNSVYFDFDNWKITRSDGTTVRKKGIRSEIEKVKIKDIEANWSIKYENKWAGQVASIKEKILHTSKLSVPAFDFEFLMKFFTALDWRGFCSNEQFESTFAALCNDTLSLDEIEIPENDRVLPSLKTASDEMKHYLLLKYYREYLNDSGVIYRNALESMKRTSFHFLIADGATKFITSDTPVFLYERSDGKVVGLLPITPDILMAQGLCTDTKEYCITHITDEAVKKYNEAIKSNADEFIILP